MAVFVSIYLTAAGRKRWGTAALISVALAAAGAYVVWATPDGTRPFQEQYLTLATIHLALLAWAGWARCCSVISAGRPSGSPS